MIGLFFNYGLFFFKSQNIITDHSSTLHAVNTNERKKNELHPSNFLSFFYFRLHVNILKSLACLRTDVLKEIMRDRTPQNLESQSDILKNKTKKKTKTMSDRRKGWKCPAGSDRMRDELIPEIKYTVYNMITAVAI